MIDTNRGFPMKQFLNDVLRKIGRKPSEKDVSDSPKKTPEPELTEDDNANEGDVSGGFAKWMQRRPFFSQFDSYMNQFNQVQEKLLSVLEKLKGISEDSLHKLNLIPQHQQQFVSQLDRQGKTLEDMLSEIQKMSINTDRLIAALEAVPKSSREQSEKLSAIEDQLQSDGQTDRELLASMNSLGQNLASLVRHVENENIRLEKSKVEFSAQIQPLIDVSTQSAKWMKVNIVLLVIIVLLMIGLAGIGYFR
jgi:small-conductance mechanosensitive channel